MRLAAGVTSLVLVKLSQPLAVALVQGMVVAVAADVRDGEWLSDVWVAAAMEVEVSVALATQHLWQVAALEVEVAVALATQHLRPGKF